MLLDYLARLTPNSTLDDLPCHDARVAATAPGQDVARLFEAHADLPGILVTGPDGSFDLLPRAQFFQQMSKPFSLALYQKRPILVLLNALPVKPLRLPGTCAVAAAARFALTRPLEFAYEPILVERPDGAARVLDLHTLLLAQAQMLEIARGTIEQQKEVAETANRFKSQFLANMSHEIRTPMNGVLGMTELVLETELSAEQRDYLETVKCSADALLSIINDILDFSKIEAGRLDLDPVEFRLRDALAAALKPLALRAHAKSLELACRIAPDVPDGLIGDPLRLRQVIVNLVGNAVKFTESGEVVVEVRIADGEQATGSVPQAPADACLLHFEVRDTGIGIPEDKRAAVFRPFEQADGSTTRKYGGTGLGLSISSRLVELMGGKIDLASAPGKGSNFFFTGQFGRAADVPTEVIPEVKLDGLSVLVVDDNATNRTILGEQLRSWGLQPTVADGGRPALGELARAAAMGEAYPLLLVDAQMPEMDGFLLLEEIRRRPDLRGAVIMMLSSADRQEDAARCRDLGVAAYLVKPVTASGLLDAIQLALGRSTLARTTSSAPAENLPRHRPLRILLAEDNAVNQKLAIALLGKQGHTITVACNGREAVEAWRNTPFDVILMDGQMPDLSGLEAAEIIRREEKARGNQHVPIIAVTAHAMKGDRERFLAAGMDDYLTKPIQARDLTRALAGIRPDDAQATTDQVPPCEPSAPVLDKAAALAAAGGDPDLFRELADIFLVEAPSFLANLDVAFQRGNAVEVSRLAHTLRGSARIFHAKAVEQSAWLLEEKGRLGNLQDAAEDRAALGHAVEQLAAALTALSFADTTPPESSRQPTDRCQVPAGAAPAHRRG